MIPTNDEDWIGAFSTLQHHVGKHTRIDYTGGLASTSTCVPTEKSLIIRILDGIIFI